MPTTVGINIKDEALSRAGVPVYLWYGIRAYLSEGMLPGHFLTAVLENDLREAVARADAQTMNGLKAIVTFLSSNAPNTFGSRELVRAWIEKFKRDD